jgi:DNA repair protein RecN (Recombination protein N)
MSMDKQNKGHMEDLRQLLVEITAQGQTVQVGSPDLQRQWLDELWWRSRASAAATSEPGLCKAATAARRKLEDRQRAERERLEKLDLLQLISKS